MSVASEAGLLFQVEPSGGEVVVSLGKGEVSDDRILVVWQDNVGIPFGTLVRWTEGHGARFRQGNQFHLPQQAPGNYTVCLGAAAVVASSELDAWKNRASCASGYLSAASALDLRLP